MRVGVDGWVGWGGPIQKCILMTGRAESLQHRNFSTRASASGAVPYRSPSPRAASCHLHVLATQPPNDKSTLPWAAGAVRQAVEQLPPVLRGKQGNTPAASSGTAAQGASALQQGEPPAAGAAAASTPAASPERGAQPAGQSASPVAGAPQQQEEQQGEPRELREQYSLQRVLGPLGGMLPPHGLGASPPQLAVLPVRVALQLLAGMPRRFLLLTDGNEVRPWQRGIGRGVCEWVDGWVWGVWLVSGDWMGSWGEAAWVSLIVAHSLGQHATTMVHVPCACLCQKRGGQLASSTPHNLENLPALAGQRQLPQKVFFQPPPSPAAAPAGSPGARWRRTRGSHAVNRPARQPPGSGRAVRSSRSGAACRAGGGRRLAGALLWD